jgi:hypothetical protein
MKLAILSIFSLIATASAFAPASMQKTSSALQAEPIDRKAFLSTAALSLFGAAVAGPAFAMDQDNVSDPTEQWETGSPTASAEAARMGRYTNARTQMNSNFPPIKRLTLERKSPVVS